MTVIDFDVHLSHREGGVALTIDQLLLKLDACGIDRAITWPMVTYTRQVSDDNRAIGQAAKKHGDRIIPFGGINPMLGTASAEEEFKRCVEEYGVRGIKLNGARDGYYVDDPNLAMPLIEKIAARGLILALHCGINDPIHTHPWLIGNIARQFPELTIIMVHMGGAGVPGLEDAAIKIVRQFPNVHPAPSESSPRAILRAINELGAERVLFASDIPFTLGDPEIAVFDAILKRFDVRTRELVMGQNAARLLQL